MKKDTIKRLGDAELEIMLIIWEADEPVTSNYILEKLAGKRKWALSTLMTVLSRLTERRFLQCEKRERNYYSALVTEKEYKVKEGSLNLEKLYGNSISDLITTLYKGKVINNDDLEELRRFIDKISDEG
ncbi:BlaI/MecI/CopY family transcriptional regulator [Konateibacter massiliensis]|uniref:BlaI/MecI/CopY family transcriptional regulator n=1 Tax=Konateibacter massiliensis TaxID=2002841 RepID=UPI000C1493DF|nr:BlaI/MecI/CopY family transcriptional regulator [Konateibacter massiliensis]